MQRERLDVEMKPSVDQHGRLRDPFLGAVPFVARLRGPGIAARAEAVPHAGMSPPVYRSGGSGLSALAWRLGMRARVARRKVSTARNVSSFPFQH